MLPKKNFAGNDRLRCRACEGWLNGPSAVNPNKFGVQQNEHGAVLRECDDCDQVWLGYVQKLPNHKIKIILKMIDK